VSNIYEDLPKPFFVLAPMDDVTDTVFRQLIATTAAPDLFFTEFVNVDALQSAGRQATLPRLQHVASEKPLIAQIWGKHPENYYKSAKDIAEMGFEGVDINMGCPAKDVVSNGCCSALINNREMALEIIQATREGAGTSLPISVKTRLGFNEVDYTWHELLLKQKLNALSIHGRTKKQMSKVPADWAAIGHVRELRDKLSPDTLIIGNGDVETRAQGQELAEKYSLDGVMIGRGIFHDPYLFAKDSEWAGKTPTEKMQLYAKHVKLFAETWKNNEKPVVILNKFCKIYISGFDGAKELREKLMQAKSTDELLEILS
jgi:tRNA-dihydrouridine synthase